MAFPGRFNEKKKSKWKFYAITAAVAALLIACVWSVVDTIRTPLTKQQKEDISSEKKAAPGAIKLKANKFSNDVNQVLHGDPLKRPEKPAPVSSVVYSPPDAKDPGKDKRASDYYSDQR